MSIATAMGGSDRNEGACPGDQRSPELTVLLPCLDEAETVGVCVDKALGFLHDMGVDGEVLVVDNGSVDETAAIAVRHGARLIAVEAKGYGNALRAGIEAAAGQFVIMSDADDSYDLSGLAPFLTELRAGSQLVVGNRFRGGIEPGAMPFLHRYLGNPLLSLIGRVFFGSRLSDFHCGLRGFDRDAIRGLGLVTSGMEFASEMIVKATLQGLRITEVPTSLSPDARSREPHLHTWRDGWRHLRFLLLYSPNWLFLYPGLGLLLVGLATMAWLLPGPQRWGDVSFDIHTLAYGTAAIICGFQATTLAILTKVYAMEVKILPPDPVIERFRSAFSLEGGLIVGLLMFAIGVGVSVQALRGWGETAFSDLDPATTMRAVLPSIALMVVGSQIVLTSFFYSALGLLRRR